MDKAVMLRGRIVNDGNHCSDECTWLIKLGLNVHIPLFQDGAFCSLYRNVLDADIRNGKTIMCDMCKTIEEGE